MNEKNKNSILLEYIEAVIAEEENQLYQTFIQPFVDVGTTAAYGIERLSAQVQTLVKGFLLGLPTLFVPFLEYDYSAFREQEKAKVEAIKKKYEGVLKANLDAITSNDAFGLAFLLAPGAVLAGQLAVKAPEAALKALEVLTGGSEFLAHIRQALTPAANVGIHDPGGHAGGAWQGGGAGGDHIQEATDPTAAKEIQKALKDKKVQAALKNGKVARQMRAEGVAVIVGHIQKFMQLQDYDQMRRMAKGDVGFNQIGSQLARYNQSGQIPADNNPIITNAMVPKLKQIYRDFWVKQMQQLSTQFPEARDELVNGIKQIQALQ